MLPEGESAPEAVLVLSASQADALGARAAADALSQVGGETPPLRLGAGGETGGRLPPFGRPGGHGVPPLRLAGSAGKRGPGHWIVRLLREVTITILPAVAIALFMHLFLAQSSIVFGESMQPTFRTDQRLIIEKVTYQFRSPQRGDVVVLKDPDGGPIPLIKRVVGLPGEKVTIARGTVYVDGEPLSEPYLDQATEGPSRSWTVPPFDVFVLGDNRSNSRDSRFFGPVSISGILGHAIFRYWPLNKLGLPR